MKPRIATRENRPPSLRLGRLRRCLLHLAGRSRFSLDARCPHRSAARRIRLVARHHRYRRFREPRALRPDRALRRRPHGPLRPAPGGGHRAAHGLPRGLATGAGWRWVGVTIAIAALAAVPIVLLLLRNDPADVGLLPYGAPSDYVAPERSSNPVRTAFSALHDVRTSGAFWLLFGSFFICGLSTNGLIHALHLGRPRSPHR